MRSTGGVSVPRACLVPFAANMVSGCGHPRARGRTPGWTWRHGTRPSSVVSSVCVSLARRAEKCERVSGSVAQMGQ